MGRNRSDRYRNGWNQFKMNSDESLLESWNTWLSLLKHPYPLGWDLKPCSSGKQSCRVGEVSQQSIGAGAHKLPFPCYTEMIQLKNLRTNPARLVPGFCGAVFFSPPLKLYPLSNSAFGPTGKAHSLTRAKVSAPSADKEPVMQSQDMKAHLEQPIGLYFPPMLFPLGIRKVELSTGQAQSVSYSTQAKRFHPYPKHFWDVFIKTQILLWQLPPDRAIQ